MTDVKSNNTSFAIPSVIQRYVLDLGSYDDPCFVFIYSKDDPVRRFKVLESLFEAELEDDFSLFKLNDDICFASLFCDYIDIENIAENIVNTFNQQNIMVNVSVFRHNPIGVAKDTFYWGIKQLESLVASKESPSFMINDFTDTKNWPGIAQYTGQNTGLADTVEVKDNAENKKGFIQRKISDVKHFINKTGSTKTSNNDAAEVANLSPGLKMLHPFITNLPQGELFWQYVLSGAYEQQLKESNAFIDLDEILLLGHAKKYAPEFFDHVLNSTRRDSMPLQNDIHYFLSEVLQPLSKELLKVANVTPEQKACFLRILDIFFHLFDQKSFQPNIFKLVVKRHKCISEQSYLERFSVTSKDNAEEISAETEREINAILDALESYYNVENENLTAIMHCFSGKRKAYDHTLWQNDESTSLLLCAILLNFDKKEQIQDQYTEALTQFIDDQLLEKVIMAIEENSHSSPEGLVPWLQGDDTIEFNALMQALRTSLEVVWGSDVNAPQPKFKLFDDMNDFILILSSYYWRLNTSYNETAHRLIKLAMAIAPQATLSCFSRLYRSSYDGFATPELEEAFFKSLMPMNIDKYAQIAFKLRIAFNHCFEQYEPLLNEYVQLSDSERSHWDNAINKFNAYDRDYFYLDVYRVNPKLTNPLAEKRIAVLAELAKLSSYLDNQAFAHCFDKSQVMFADDLEGLPEKLELPLRHHAEMQPNKNGLDFAVLLCTGQQHELLIDSSSDPVPEEGEWPAVNDLTILKNVKATEVIEVINNMKVREQRILDSQQVMTRYIDGEMSLAECLTTSDLDTKEFYLDNELYSDHAPKILPQILTEADEAKQLRLIKLFTSDPRRGKKVLEELIEALFFDHQLQEGNIDLETRKEIELEDITSAGTKAWKNYHQQFITKLAAM